jgi:Zn-dependent peptidase ImmA (M78 family)
LALANLYERPINWFLERGAPLSNVRYRNSPSRLRVGDRHRFEGDVHRWIEAYVAIEERLDRRLVAEFDGFRARRGETEAELAIRVRRALGMHVEQPEPIPSVVEVLERFGIRTLEHSTDLRIDGLAARYGKEHVVVLNRDVANDRCRLNAAHELGHILYGDCDRKEIVDCKATEKRAFQFASHLLLPNRRLKEAFTGQSVVRLVQYKERYGISLAAMVYQAEKQRIITKPVARRLWAEFTKRGWKSREPGQVRPDRATRFEQLIDSAIFDNRISLREASAVAGVKPEDLQARIDLAMGIHSCSLSIRHEDPPILTLKPK